ncbi:MAG: penicillin acylase family protein [Chloroflexota bacterium]|nr:MAG: penicillin acylase family protein [Chloroflexota bacterium]
MKKALLAIVAVLLIASIGFACGPGPEPEPEPEERCTIIRDNFGVPHVFADTKADLAYGAGYAMAQDRLWQADVLRRAAKGRLAEFGLASVGEDAATRTLWYSEAELQQIYDEWDPGTGNEHLKPMIEAYVEGINTYIGEARINLALMPIEYFGSGLIDQLEDFSVTDVVGLTVLMGWRFGGCGGNEADFYEALLTLQAMHGATLGGAIWQDLFPLDDAGAPVTIPGSGCAGPLSTGVASLDIPDNFSGILQQYKDFWASQDALFKSLGIPTKFGSNAVPVSGDLSASGHPMELGGPQMGYSIPQIVWDLGLHGAGINAQGMAIPGSGPFILIGVSDYGAWTSTTGSSDNMDIRILDLNPMNPFQYWHDGAWVDMEARIETIYDSDGIAHNETCYRSLYGPIVSLDPGENMAVTLHVPFYKDEIAYEQGWEMFQEATNIAEFETAVDHVGCNHNFYWADTAGNIGYWHAGRFPIKPMGADRRLPLYGNGTQEWDGVTGPDDIPKCINPTQGWLANWNNKPIAGWQYAESDFHWGEGFRVQVLMDAMALFAAAGDLTTDDLNTLNQIGGYHNTAGMNFAGNVTAAALASANATLQTAGSYLYDWATATPLPASYVDLVSPMYPEPDPTYDHPGLTIFNAWYDKVVPAVFSGILPSNLINEVKGSSSLLTRVFREDAGLLYPTYPSGGTLDNLIIDALGDAVDELTGVYGADMSTWLTPVQMQSYDVQGALPQAFEHPRMNRGTYGHLAEMSTPQNAVNVIPPGTSGFMGVTSPPTPSPHAYDQVALYASWTYKPMLYSLAAVEAVETSRTVFYVEE